VNYRTKHERRWGKLYREMRESGEARSPQSALKRGPDVASDDKGKTLPDLGVTRDQASQWQKLDPDKRSPGRLVIAGRGLLPEGNLIGSSSRVRVHSAA